MSNSNGSRGGIGLFGMMFIVLFAGKIFEIGAVATWSWWAVAAPLWIPVAVLLGVLIAGWAIVEWF